MEPRTEVVRELVRGDCGTVEEAAGSEGPRRVREMRRGREEVAVAVVGEGLWEEFSLGFSGAAMVGVVGEVESEGRVDFGGEGAGAARGIVVVIVSVIRGVDSVERAGVVLGFFLAGFSEGVMASIGVAGGSGLGGSSSLLRFLLEELLSFRFFSLFSFLADFFSWLKVGVDIGRGEIGGFEKIWLKSSAATLLDVAFSSSADAANIASLLSFFASFSFIPLLLRFVSVKPRASALISPGASCFPGADVAILSTSMNSSPFASASALYAR